MLIVSYTRRNNAHAVTLQVVRLVGLTMRTGRDRLRCNGNTYGLRATAISAHGRDWSGIEMRLVLYRAAMRESEQVKQTATAYRYMEKV